jgi:hypothetical protein
MKLYISLIATVLLFSKCRECSNDVNYGERVLIPVQFEDYTLQEINEAHAVRIDRTTLKRDSFDFRQIMAAYSAYNYSTQITDRPQSGSYSDYESYLNNSDLIIIRRNRDGSDTLSNIVIKKSKAEVDKCHKDDPNVRVDEVSFVYKGKTYTRNQVVTITK